MKRAKTRLIIDIEPNKDILVTYPEGIQIVWDYKTEPIQNFLNDLAATIADWRSKL